MSKKRRVIVRGGGANLYEIEEYGGRFHAAQVRVGLLGDSRKSIGSGSRLDDALALIRSHSGKEIERID